MSLSVTNNITIPWLHHRSFRQFLIFSVLILSWQVYVWLSGVSPLLFPSPIAVLQALFQDVGNSKILMALKGTLSLLLTGVAIALVLGTGLAAIARTSKFGQDLLDVLVAIFNPLPPVALLPLVMIWFGITPTSILIVIVHASIWIIAINTDMGFRTIHPTILMVGKNLGLPKLKLIWDIMLPAALPYIFTGLKTAWASSWRSVIAAELVFGVAGASGGLGWYINDSRFYLLTANVFAGLAVIALLGLAVDVLFKLLESLTIAKWGMQNR